MSTHLLFADAASTSIQGGAIGLAVVTLAKIIDTVLAKHRPRPERELDERTQISRERAELMGDLRTQLEDSRRQTEACRTESSELRGKVNDLYDQNDALRRENGALRQDVYQLQQAVERIQRSVKPFTDLDPSIVSALDPPTTPAGDKGEGPETD